MHIPLGVSAIKGWRDLQRNSVIRSGVSAAGRRWAPVATVILLMSLLTSCQGSLAPQTASVQIKGSETLRPLLTLCAEDFMTRWPHIDVIVQGGGSDLAQQPGFHLCHWGTVGVWCPIGALSVSNRAWGDVPPACV
jgi:hypothetical protein